MQSRHELAEVVREYAEQLHTAHPQGAHALRTLRAIALCRTAALGGHVCRCTRCQHVHPAYNSCRNRHCPKCQSTQRERWVRLRAAELQHLGGCFHLVFTMPHQLNALCLSHPKPMYDALFAAAAATIAALGRNPKFLGAQTGMVAILHTWGQQLSLHPHLHCIVPAGGLTLRRKWKSARGHGKYLFPQKAMAAVFRAKYLCEATERLAAEKQIIPQHIRRAVLHSPWVVYAKAPLRGNEQIIEYLGRYSHKIAISNHRLREVNNAQVRFAYKDYRHGGAPKEMTLSAVEFLRRFCLHILPAGFRRIRHFGFLASRNKAVVTEPHRAELLRIKALPWQELCNHQPLRCPRCGGLTLQIIQTITPSRGPPLIIKARNLNTNSQ